MNYNGHFGAFVPGGKADSGLFSRVSFVALNWNIARKYVSA